MHSTSNELEHRYVIREGPVPESELRRQAARACSEFSVQLQSIGWSHMNSSKSCKVPARGYRAPKNAFWSQLHRYAPQKPSVFGGLPAKNTVERDVPEKL